jgi:hypothetical protein
VGSSEDIKKILPPPHAFRRAKKAGEHGVKQGDRICYRKRKKLDIPEYGKMLRWYIIEASCGPLLYDKQCCGSGLEIICKLGSGSKLSSVSN